MRSRAAAAVREAKPSNAVGVCATPSFAVRWLLPRLPLFEQAHPRIEVSVVVDQGLTELESSGVDLAIRMGRGPWPDVHCVPLMDDLLYPVMSPTYWNEARRPVAPSSLAGLRLLHDRDPQASWSLWREAYGPKKLDVRSGPRLASSDLLLRAAVLGQGVALARHRLAADDVASGALVRPFGQLGVELETAYWIVVSRASRMAGSTGRFIEWLHSQVRPAPL